DVLRDFHVTGVQTFALPISGKHSNLSINYLDDYVVGTPRMSNNIDIKDTELVFAGFGIVAPEYKWNDYEGLDVKGKTVVVMVSRSEERRGGEGGMLCTGVDA